MEAPINTTLGLMLSRLVCELRGAGAAGAGAGACGAIGRERAGAAAGADEAGGALGAGAAGRTRDFVAMAMTLSCNNFTH